MPPAQPASPAFPDAPDQPVRWLAGFHMAFQALIVLGMTALTHNLDDIKMAMFLAFGPLLFAGALGAIALGAAPVPRGLMPIGFAAYAAVALISTLLSELSWAGWPFLAFLWSSAGFFLSAMAIGANERTSWTYVRFLAALLLIVNLFGFMQFDFRGTGGTVTAWLYDLLYAGRARTGEPSSLQSLLYTFKSEARLQLMSTILNRDFYAAFLLLHVPMAACAALLARGWKSRSVAVATTLLSLASVFLCKSKGEYVFGAAEGVFFLGLYFIAARQRHLRTSGLLAWIGGIGVLMGALFLINLPSLMLQLKTLSFSVSSRRIIFEGAVKLFLDNPVLGSGPGTFKLFFPQYRSPDYFEHEISNVTELAHNYILDILSETGLAGAAAFACFALPLAAGAFRALFTSSDMRLRLLILGCLAGLFGMYGSNMTSTSGRWPIGGVGLWSMMGLLAGFTRRAGGWVPGSEPSPLSEAARPGVSPWRRFLPPAAAVLAALGVFSGVRMGVRYWVVERTYNQGLQYFERVMRFYEEDLRNPNLPEERRRDLIDQLNFSGERFRRAAAMYPSHLSAYYKLGSVENTLADLDPARFEEHVLESKKAYDTLERYAPDYAELHYNKGIVYYRLTQIMRRKLAALKPEEADQKAKFEELKEAYMRESLRFFEKMGEMSVKPDVFTQLGQTYLDLREFERAKAIFKRAMDRYPDKKVALGPGVYFADKYAEAAAALGDASAQFEGIRARWRIHPGERFRLYDALDLAIKNGLEEPFDELLAEALERNPVDPVLFLKGGIMAEKRGNQAGVAKAASDFLKLTRDAELARQYDLVRKERKDCPAREDFLAKGAAAAAGLGDADTAKRLYSALASGESPHAAAARAWLAANGG